MGACATIKSAGGGLEEYDHYHRRFQRPGFGANILS